MRIAGRSSSRASSSTPSGCSPRSAARRAARRRRCRRPGAACSRACRGRPGLRRCAPPFERAQAGRVDADPIKVDAASLAELVQQHQAQAVEHPGALPLFQPPPRGRGTAAASSLAGSSAQGVEVRVMNTSAAKQLRSGTTRRRPYRGAGGSRGATSAQSSSGTRRSTNNWAIAEHVREPAGPAQVRTRSAARSYRNVL